MSNSSCLEVWPGVICGAHGVCDESSRRCECVEPGWGSSNEFAVLRASGITCDYNLGFVWGVALLGAIANAGSLLIQCYVTRTVEEARRTWLPLFGFCCGLLVAAQRMWTPLDVSLLGEDMAHSVLFAGYISSILGTVLKFFERFVLAIARSAESEGADSSHSAHVRRQLPRVITLNIAANFFFLVASMMMGVVSFQEWPAVWAASMRLFTGWIALSSLCTGCVTAYMATRVLHVLDCYLELGKHLRGSSVSAAPPDHDVRLRRNMVKLRSVRTVNAAFFSSMFITACLMTLSTPFMYASKYTVPVFCYAASAAIGLITALLFSGGIRHRRVAPSTSRGASSRKINRSSGYFS
jgi:hypothetical protein